jgi:hypothetical protein
MKQVTARELDEFAAVPAVGGVVDDAAVRIEPEMRDRLVATIRHLRAVIRRKRHVSTIILSGSSPP